MDELPNIIATSSLLLAVVTALMSFWYADVTKAIGENEPRLPAERRTLREKIRPVFWSKALPLAVGATTIATIFLSRAIGILVAAVQGFGRGLEYDDMQAAFVVTEGLMLLLAVVTVRLAWQLGRKGFRLKA